MNVVNEAILSMIKKGDSLNKINKKTGIGKSTLYFHYKKLNGKKISIIKFNFPNENELGEFMGIFAGDGSFCKRPKSHYVLRVYIGFYEKHYADALNIKFQEWFSKKPQIYFSYYKGKKSMITLCYYSKVIYNLIKEYLQWDETKTLSVKLKELDLNKKKFNMGFLRGLIDTDGNFYAPKKRVSFSTTSKVLASQVFVIIQDLIEINPNLNIIKKEGRHDLYTLTLYGKNAKKLINLIKPRNINKNAALVQW